MIKHIWKYLTSPPYRFWIDFCAREENLDMSMGLVLQNLAMQTYPLFQVEDGKIMARMDAGEVKKWVGSIGDAGEPQKVKPRPNQY